MEFALLLRVKQDARRIIEGGDVATLTRKMVRNKLKEMHDTSFEEHKDEVNGVILAVFNEVNISAEEKRLRDIIACCGLSAQTRFKNASQLSPGEIISRLDGILMTEFGSTNPSTKEIKKFKKKRAMEVELDGCAAFPIPLI